MADQESGSNNQVSVLLQFCAYKLKWVARYYIAAMELAWLLTNWSNADAGSVSKVNVYNCLCVKTIEITLHKHVLGTDTLYI